MKKIQSILPMLALALPFGAHAADAQPSFLTPARSAAQPAPHLGTSPIAKPQLAITPAPRVSEMRAVPGPDGELHIVCHEVPNPKLRAQAAADAEHPTP
ncbi:MAG TPA: hypothetical protein VM555_02495 [Tahibacter sp.]|nr:hypothetical protein [Tahibacter sp.]